MQHKLTADYAAGVISGAGLLLFLLALAVDSGLLNADGLRGAGVKFAGLAMLLGGSGLQWRSRATVKN